ncbi:MAG: Nif3-like dinuclear metal center hexameric protein [Thermoanaerobaculia bacterium]|nr:Nif3-like dinuclear metal center hexameric protein [Thermoanaerobaculia bacterium]
MTPASAVDLATLVAHLDAYLDTAAGRDYGPNGLQVEGKREIARLVTGVSASEELLGRAAERGADAVLVHHGLFWEGSPRVITGPMRRKVATLLHREISLLAYHLPLDRHPEVGNNAVAARALGLVELAPFALHEGLPTGFRGRFPEPVPAAELVARCRGLFRRDPLAFLAGPDPLSTVGIVSGGAQREVHQAIAAGLDAYVTGEATEWVMATARENRIHYLAVGHHAGERLGVMALGEHLARRFGIEVEFVDVPNPV